MLPSAPQDFRVANVKARTVLLKWAEPEMNKEDVTYLVRYAAMGRQFRQIEVRYTSATQVWWINLGLSQPLSDQNDGPRDCALPIFLP